MKICPNCKGVGRWGDWYENPPLEYCGYCDGAEMISLSRWLLWYITEFYGRIIFWLFIHVWLPLYDWTMKPTRDYTGIHDIDQWGFVVYCRRHETSEVNNA